MRPQTALKIGLNHQSIVDRLKIIFFLGGRLTDNKALITSTDIRHLFLNAQPVSVATSLVALQ